MTWTQNAAPNTSVTSRPGWCLEFTQKVYDAPVAYSCATEAREALGQLFPGNRDLPPVSVPVWFSWTGTLDGVTKDWGHVAAWVPGLGILSSPKSWDQGDSQSVYASIEEVESWLGATYIGFSADLNGLQVATYIEDPAPQPEPAPEPAPAGQTYTVVEGDTLWDIAGKFYNDNTRWPDIYNANTAVIGVDPNLIIPGQVLTIP
jgi:LysM repeat protein